jgi:hypothetical protein
VVDIAPEVSLTADMVMVAIRAPDKVAAVGIRLFTLPIHTPAGTSYVAPAAIVRLAQVRLAGAAVFIAVCITVVALRDTALTVLTARVRMVERAVLLAAAAVFGIFRSNLTAVVRSLIAIEIAVIAERDHAAAADTQCVRM